MSVKLRFQLHKKAGLVIKDAEEKADTERNIVGW